MRAIPEKCIEAEAGLRVRKKLRTRASLVSAAVELFAEKGYDATTVEEIAARAEVSPMTFFRYFGSKDEVMFSEREANQARFCQALLERPPSEDDLTAARNAARAAFRDDTDLERLELQERSVSTMPVLAGRLYANRRDWEDVIASTLAERRGARSPSLGAKLTASVIMATLALGMRIWHESSDGQPPARSIDQVFAQLCRQYSPPPR